MVATNPSPCPLPGAQCGAEAIQSRCAVGLVSNIAGAAAVPDSETHATRADFCSTAGGEERVDGVVHAQYIWCLRYIDSPVLRDRDTTDNQTLDERLYYTTDANMDVTALLASGSRDVVERYVYDPYGRIEVLTGSGNPDPGGWDDFENEILFTGHRLNPETGLYHARHLAYHPSLGRFMQRYNTVSLLCGFIGGTRILPECRSETNIALLRVNKMRKQFE